MTDLRASFPKTRLTRMGLALGFFCLLVVTIVLVNCGGGGSSSTQVSSNLPVGSASVSLSDPPACKGTNPGDFKSVFVSIRSVQAHTSASATDDSAGWQELAPQLVTQPVQIDLLGVPQNGCFLAMLGSTAALPVGDYQQIRLLLVSNNPSPSDPKPATNACSSLSVNIFNCVVLSDGTFHEIDLSSQANTGLKIPPGQVVGGPIRVQQGQSVGLNIDFNTCASLILMPDGTFRLKPALTAGQVSTASNSISGQVVDSKTMLPIAGKVIVALELADNTGVDRVVMETTADASGNFSFCPVPMGTFDLVAVAIGPSNLGYNATVVLSVTAGNAVSKVPLVAEVATTPGPATIKGTVTSASAPSGMPPVTTGVSVDVALSALQTISLSSGSSRMITIPLEGMSTATIATASGGTCPTGTDCANYTLVVAASNPSIGTFAASGTTFSTPATGDVLYTVESDAAKPMSGGTADCSPSTVTTTKDSSSMPLKVTPGATVTAATASFTGCS